MNTSGVAPTISWTACKVAGTVNNEYLHLELDELTREVGKPGSIAIGAALVDDQIPPLDVSEVPQPESKRLDVGRFAGCVSQVADPAHVRRLLREFGELRD